MKEPKRYYCGNGNGMFEDNENGHWIEYSEHKAIIEALTEQLHLHGVIKSVCDKCNGLRAVPSFGTFIPCDACNQ